MLDAEERTSNLFSYVMTEESAIYAITLPKYLGETFNRTNFMLIMDFSVNTQTRYIFLPHTGTVSSHI